MSYSRDAIVAQAKAWIGCKESDGSHKQIIDTYNSHKPLARGYKVKYTDHWCATYVSAVAIKCGYTAIIPTECSCSKMIELFKKMNAWQENDAYVPSPGDIIFYDWDDNGAGDNKGASDHVGIVEKVVGTKITIIEGNYSESVKRRVIGVNSRYIRGYGVPNYSKIGIVPKTKIVATDHAMSKDKAVAGTYVATADNLNVRHGAGTNKRSMVTISEGTTVKNYGFYTKSSTGQVWLYVQFTYNGVTYTGFCSSKYLRKKG